MRENGSLPSFNRTDAKDSIKKTFISGTIFILMLLITLCGCHGSSDNSSSAASNTTVTYSTGVLDTSKFNSPNGFIVTQADLLGTSTDRLWPCRATAK